jgi:hypothetical protein
MTVLEYLGIRMMLQHVAAVLRSDLGYGNVTARECKVKRRSMNSGAATGSSCEMWCLRCHLAVSGQILQILQTLDFSFRSLDFS